MTLVSPKASDEALSWTVADAILRVRGWWFRGPSLKHTEKKLKTDEMWAPMADNRGPRLVGENHQFSAFLSVYTRFHLKNAVKHIKITWKVIVFEINQSFYCISAYNSCAQRKLSLSMLFLYV